jgi:branched-subunit amino acid aminotransferase/4-amino-4-deoxychorismate lyase
LEENKANEVNEILLWHSESSEIYEGTQSNFAVIRKDINEEYFIQTAPFEHVLKGTILDLVLKICDSLKIRVDLSFPKLTEISSWEGAFVSSKPNYALLTCSLA